MTVLVTGGAGYIGSHTAYALLDAGYSVIIIDDLSTGVVDNIPATAHFIQSDIGDASQLSLIFHKFNIDAVMHFAGSLRVEESVSNPLLYYHNNTSKTRTLLQACLDHDVRKFIFSSSAAVYGQPERSPVDETTTPSPINPYGTSKLMTEWMLRDIATASDFRYVALRYFNVAGADPLYRTGESTANPSHLIKIATQAILGQRSYVEIYGNDYPTPDGTCVRDYIHVSDLAHAHVLALEYLTKGGKSSVLNCGYGHGYSVQEVLSAIEQVANKQLTVHYGARRAGDPAILVAQSDRLKDQFLWQPKYDNLEFILSTALEWERRIS